MGKNAKISAIKKEYTNLQETMDSQLSNKGLTRIPGTGVFKFPYKEINGKYRTGLDPDAAYINRIEDSTERELEKKRVAETKKRLEASLGGIDLGPYSTFWDYSKSQGTYDANHIQPVKLLDGDNYFDLVFNETANWFSNWKDTIVMMSDGNHETSILTHNEIDPLENVTRLMREQGSKVQHMSYQGFIWFTFIQRNPDGTTGKTRRATLAFHHGAWSGASKSTGQKYFNIFPQAQIVLNGHNHERSIINHPGGSSQ